MYEFRALLDRFWVTRADDRSGAAGLLPVVRRPAVSGRSGRRYPLSALLSDPGCGDFFNKVQPVDWTRFPHRKSLVRVLQYAQEVGLVLVYDGNKNLDQFLTGELQLYRNGAFFLLSEGERCGALFGNGWGAQLRACSSERICQELTAYMADWMLLKVLEEDILLYPAVGKLVGSYPAAYQNESSEGEEDEPLEDE